MINWGNEIIVGKLQLPGPLDGTRSRLFRNVFIPPTEEPPPASRPRGAPASREPRGGIDRPIIQIYT